MVNSGALKPIVHKTYPLAQLRDAFEENAKGHTRGKLVILVRPPSQPPKHFSLSPKQTDKVPTIPEQIIPTTTQTEPSSVENTSNSTEST